MNKHTHTHTRFLFLLPFIRVLFCSTRTRCPVSYLNGVQKLGFWIFSGKIREISYFKISIHVRRLKFLSTSFLVQPWCWRPCSPRYICSKFQADSIKWPQFGQFTSEVLHKRCVLARCIIWAVNKRTTFYLLPPMQSIYLLTSLKICRKSFSSVCTDATAYPMRPFSFCTFLAKYHKIHTQTPPE